MPIIGRCTSWLQRLCHAGAGRQPDPREQRRILINNAIALTLIGFTLPYAALL